MLANIAQDYGWEPAGTLPPPPGFQSPSGIRKIGDEWDGTYCSSDFQSVTDEDANNLASACERAMSEMEDENLKRYVRKFAKFCRDGGFLIT